MKKQNVLLCLCVLFVYLSACSPQLSFRRIKTSEDCACTEGAFWYKSKCWRDFAPEGFLPGEIDSVVDMNMVKSRYCRIKFDGGGNYPINMFMPLPIDKENSLLFMTYSDSTTSYTLISQADEKTLEKNDELDLKLVRLQGDLMKDNVDTIPKGIGAIHYSKGDDEFEYTGYGEFSFEDSSTQFTFNVNESVSGMGNSELSIIRDTARLSGDLGIITYVQIRDMVEQHPDVKVLVLDQISGSINDEVNVHTGRLIRKAGISTVVLSTSRIASGGVDLFCSGVTRHAEEGAQVGVHSWCCFNDYTAQELPEDHPAHKDQLDYFTEMMGAVDGPEFYFYTLESAPFDGVYWMNMGELIQYKVVTNEK